MNSLSTRNLEPELMDGDNVSLDEYVECLHQLSWINRWTGGYALTLKGLETFLINTPASTTTTKNESGSRRWRILDIGFGFGDTLRAIAQWASDQDLIVDLVGVDINPRATTIAQNETPSWMNIRFEAANIFEYRPSEPFDVIVNSFFMHHLRNDQIVLLLQWMAKNSRLGFFINDLHRHPLPYHFIKHATRLFSGNRLICHDASVSVARAFTSTEWRDLIKSAELSLAWISTAESSPKIMLI